MVGTCEGGESCNLEGKNDKIQATGWWHGPERLANELPITLLMAGNSIIQNSNGFPTVYHLLLFPTIPTVALIQQIIASTMCLMIFKFWKAIKKITKHTFWYIICPAGKMIYLKPKRHSQNKLSLQRCYDHDRSNCATVLTRMACW